MSKRDRRSKGNEWAPLAGLEAHAALEASAANDGANHRRLIRARIERWGFRVVCLNCAQPGRHFPRDGRIRDALCPRCGRQALASSYWVARYPELARAKREELDKLRRVFE